MCKELELEVERVTKRDNKEALINYSSEALDTIKALGEQLRKDNIKCDNKLDFLLLVGDLEIAIEALNDVSIEY